MVKVEVTVQLLNKVEVKKKYDEGITGKQLMESIHLFSGVELCDMHLGLRFQQSPGEYDLEISQSNLEMTPLRGRGFCYIVVADTNKNSLANQLLEDNHTGPEFNYTESDYERRDDTVLKWKQQEQLGRFDPQYRTRMQSDQEEQLNSLDSLTVGERCVVTTPQLERRGWLRYLGPVDTLAGIWCGIEFDTDSGKNNGTFKEKTYFGPVAENHGGFVRPHQVKTGPQYEPLHESTLLDESDEL
ncbi:Tubulin-specific chaperone B [Nakaseomyces bracarensis]|uniref:Tubulin-specific chaperone B n=1 Tax=Nakaseomyces bracarensis TaxID=273131 RepID=A0ABR4NUP6_9SACH